MKGFNLSKWALEHPALTRYLMVVLMVFGIAAYFQLGQDEDPPFTFRAMVVRTYWPGATAQQVAEQVTDKLERTLQEVPFADKIRSYSKPGESQIIFQIKDYSKPADVPNVWYTVRKKIGDIRYTLPQGVQGPFFNDEFGDVFGVIYALDAPGFTPAEIKRFADDVRQQLLRVPYVAKVEQFGVQDEKIFVEIPQKKLAQMGLDLGAVLGQLGQENAVENAGTLQSPLDVFQIRIGGQFDTEADLKAMPIRGSSGQQFKLGDIANITRGYVDPPTVKVHHQGKEVIGLGVSMAKGGDIIQLGKALQTATARIEKTLPAGVSLVQVQDQPKAVSRSVGEFVRVLIEAVLIVLVVSFVSLGLHKGGRYGWYVDVRPGLVVAITIPLVLAMTFLAMDYWGIGLHKISLGSLIIALGLLVDDAIIAVEMMVRKLEEGYDKMHAATFAYDVTAMPMLTGTLITAVGFLPIGLAKSTVGEYTFAIFAVTAASLVISWVVSVYFVPYLGTRLLKAPPHAVDFGAPHELFDGPFGWFFRATGGVPVDRSSRHNMVEQAVAVFALEDEFLLAMAPEGTRQRVDKLKTGFWHIAHAAGVPIIMAGLDFGRKEVRFSGPFPATDEVADMQRVMAFFRDVQGKPVAEYWHDMKFWWPHNEAIIATLLAWHITGDAKYAQWHQQVHDWSFAHFPDPQHGEWFGYLHRNGTPSSTLKGNLWKSFFHHPRALWMCWLLLTEESQG